MSSDVIRCLELHARQLLCDMPSEKQRHLGSSYRDRKRVIGSDLAFCGSPLFFLFQKGVTSHGEELDHC